MHIPDGERRQWVAERMEAEPPPVDSARVLERLIRAGLFEQVLQSRYIGTKRFSLEGVIALIPVMEEMLDGAAALGAEQMVFGMSHRGRLNVMVHIVGKSAEDVFARFEDVDPRSFLGGGDVKYHLGATGNYLTAARRQRGDSPGFQSLPPGSRGPRGHGAGARQAGAPVRAGYQRASCLCCCTATRLLPARVRRRKRSTWRIWTATRWGARCMWW